MSNEERIMRTIINISLAVFLTNTGFLFAADSPESSQSASALKIGIYALSREALKTLLPPTNNPTASDSDAGCGIWTVRDEEVKNALINAGVPFPPGAMATYNQRWNLLVVLNTLSNLELVHQYVNKFLHETLQVAIETRFLQMPRTLAEDLFADDDGLSRACIIKEKILKRIDDLAKQGKIVELARPKLTTVSGNTAQVKSVKEFRYPTAFDALGSGSNTNKPSEVGGARAVIMQPEPGPFETREIGSLLNVTPTIGPDGSLINLTLVPEISRVAPKMRQYTVTMPSGKVTVEQPEFSSYQTTTTVQLKSGHTMLLSVMDPVAEDGKMTQNDVVFVLLSATVIRE